MKNLIISLAIVLVALGAFGSRDLSTVEYYYLGDSNVYSLTTLGRTDSGGTGFTLTLPNGTKATITNRHVCDDALVMQANASTHTEVLEVVKVSKLTDLCMLKPLFGAPGLTLAPSSTLREDLHIIGHPGLRPITLSHGEYVADMLIDLPGLPAGIVYGKCITGEKRMVQWLFLTVPVCVESYLSGYTQAHVSPGSSGSPVLNNNGEVMGVVFAGQGNEASYFIRLEELKIFVTEPENRAPASK